MAPIVPPLVTSGSVHYTLQGFLELESAARRKVRTARMLSSRASRA